jgi:hypothetical protein
MNTSKFNAQSVSNLIVNKLVASNQFILNKGIPEKEITVNKKPIKINLVYSASTSTLKAINPIDYSVISAVFIPKTVEHNSLNSTVTACYTELLKQLNYYRGNH